MNNRPPTLQSIQSIHTSSNKLFEIGQYKPHSRLVTSPVRHNGTQTMSHNRAKQLGNLTALDKKFLLGTPKIEPSVNESYNEGASVQLAPMESVQKGHFRSTDDLYKLFGNYQLEESEKSLKIENPTRSLPGPSQFRSTTTTKFLPRKITGLFHSKVFPMTDSKGNLNVKFFLKQAVKPPSLESKANVSGVASPRQAVAKLNVTVGGAEWQKKLQVKGTTHTKTQSQNFNTKMFDGSVFEENSYISTQQVFNNKRETKRSTHLSLEQKELMRLLGNSDKRASRASAKGQGDGLLNRLHEYSSATPKESTDTFIVSMIKRPVSSKKRTSKVEKQEKTVEKTVVKAELTRVESKPKVISTLEDAFTEMEINKSVENKTIRPNEVGQSLSFAEQILAKSLANSLANYKPLTATATKYHLPVRRRKEKPVVEIDKTLKSSFLDDAPAQKGDIKIIEGEEKSPKSHIKVNLSLTKEISSPKEKSRTMRKKDDLMDKKFESLTDKEKDIVCERKMQAYRDFMAGINFSFNIVIKMDSQKSFTSYKYYVGRGNNNVLIRSLMKQRWWWTLSDKKDGADLNFKWTQLKSKKFISSLKKRRKAPLEILESPILNPMKVSTTHLESFSTLGDADNTEIFDKSLVASFVRQDTGSTGGEGLNGFEKLLTDNEVNLVYMQMNSGAKPKKKLGYQDYEQLSKSKKEPSMQVISQPNLIRMCNHVEDNYHLANKKALLWNLKSYYETLKQNPFSYIPLTFHIQKGLEDPEFKRFVEFFEKLEKEGKEAVGGQTRNTWIVKPGEDTNRGFGINVSNDMNKIKELVSDCSEKRTYLIQKYIENPLLYNRRKFDIRCYILVSCINNTMKGYWYQEGYIRTSSKEFSLKNLSNRLIHLTNAAVQKKAEDYGKFETGNKLTFNDFQKYLQLHQGGNMDFYTHIYPQFKSLATDAIKSVYGKIDPYRREHYFEIFGLDFMIDDLGKAWLIEVNTNPDITTDCSVLMKIIPDMVDNALKLSLDPMFPPPNWANPKKQIFPSGLLEANKFELVFDEIEDGPILAATLNLKDNLAGNLIFEMEVEEDEDGIDEDKN